MTPAEGLLIAARRSDGSSSNALRVSIFRTIPG
jgi:hypothetical protein